MASLARSWASALVCGRRLHVGADAAVPEQVDRGLEDAGHQLGRREARGLQAQRPAGLRAEVDALGGARVDPAALADQAGVVVGPGGARQGEEALALLEGGRRVGIGVDEDVAVIERRQRASILSDSSMPLPNTSPDMSPTPTTVKGSVAGSRPSSRKWRLTDSQAPLGGDPHALVVVAGGAARGEGVAEPEAVGLADLVRVVREGGGALVGGHDEVGVVIVVADDAVGVDDTFTRQVVGDVEQAGEEEPCSSAPPLPSAPHGRPRPAAA